MKGRSHMGCPVPALFTVFTTTSMDSGREGILVKYCLSESGRIIEFQKLITELKTHLIYWKNCVKSTIRNSEKTSPQRKEKSVVQTQDVEKQQLRVKHQFCRRVSAITLAHCSTISKNYAKATKPPHLILTQFTKIITYRRHARAFFSCSPWS